MREAKKRRCLKCQDEFDSQHRGNRLCDACRAQNDAWVSTCDGLTGFARLQNHGFQVFCESIGTEAVGPRPVPLHRRRRRRGEPPQGEART